MTTLIEGKHAGEYLVSEATVGGAGVSRSRDAIVVASGQNLVAGAVLGVSTAGTATAAADAGNTGDGVMGAITVSGSASAGDYKLTIIEAAANAGAFSVENPNGEVIGSGNVAAAFSDGGLAFTLADGATDFAAGDIFVITVVPTSLSYVEYNPAGTDGSQNVAGILFDNTDATLAAKDAVAHTRDFEFHAGEITWKTGTTQSEIDAGLVKLAALGAIAR